MAQHLGGQEPSSLVHLLQSLTPLKVQAARDGQALLPGTVLVVPPGRHAELENLRLRLHAVPAGTTPAPSIDRLLASAAGVAGRVIGIILSGTGRDGAVGARTLRDAGGTLWAERPQEAPFASMPQAIVSRELADHVDTAAALGRRLGSLTAARHGGQTPDSTMAGERDALAALITLLAEHTGLDLQQYQTATLRRPFERILRQEGLPSLAALLRAGQQRPELLGTPAQSAPSA
ncbi:chemotaxis protein CheB [Tepidimonas sp.]|uniref:chemotaxis protein CheB n=1 Tax=Tepidimonas sp. TaxID=2002775 RepID=UPI002FE09833